jgi:hypothetical protein
VGVLPAHFQETRFFAGWESAGLSAAPQIAVLHLQIRRAVFLPFRRGRLGKWQRPLAISSNANRRFLHHSGSDPSFSRRVKMTIFNLKGAIEAYPVDGPS